MPAYFIDTSAILPRYLRRARGHKWVAGVCDPRQLNTIALAEITDVEIASTLNQLVRGGTLKQRQRDEALALFWSHVDGGQYTLITIATSTIRRTAALCDVHSLKGYDAVQLACALTFRDDVRSADAAAAATPGAAALGDPIFLTEDTRLTIAAHAEGFAVDTPAAHP